MDQCGIPVLRFHFRWSEPRYKQVKHMHQTFASIIETMGGTRDAAGRSDPKAAISAGGTIIHEAGRCAWATTRRLPC